MINIDEAVSAIKKVGTRNARIVSMSTNKSQTGPQQLEIQENGIWKVIADNISYKTANNIISKATNRLIVE